VTGLCRRCFAPIAATDAQKRCPACGSPRLVRHKELDALSIAHLDCDAFYAAIEKRDDESLKDKPVIVGGGKRGVVSTACYVARTYGIHSAQPMFKALALCPQAIVIKPNMAKYAVVGRLIRERMLALTPMVEPLSLDEAFLDLSGTERLHHRTPAETLARLQAEIERDVGITVSIGLSYCKFLAKAGSELDKPRGFSVIGRSEACAFLEHRPVSYIWGVGRALTAQLQSDGLKTIGDLAKLDEGELMRRYGSIGRRLSRLARGLDERRVDPQGERKSISSETTFMSDISDQHTLQKMLWRQAERVAERAKTAGLAGRTVSLKLKQADFRLKTRHRKLDQPTGLADTLFRVGRELLHPLTDGTRYRLIGIGLEDLVAAEIADGLDLGDPRAQERRKAELAMDKVRAKYGRGAILKGRGLS
jgi:DNA polymerase-4